MRGPSPGVAPSPHSACLAQFFRSLAGSNMNVMINDMGEDHVPPSLSYECLVADAMSGLGGVPGLVEVGAPVEGEAFADLTLAIACISSGDGCGVDGAGGFDAEFGLEGLQGVGQRGGPVAVDGSVPEPGELEGLLHRGGGGCLVLGGGAALVLQVLLQRRVGGLVYRAGDR